MSFHVHVRGSGSPVVVLESGIAASSLSWALVQDRIAAFTTVVSYDRAGFGFSDAPTHPCTAADAAGDLALVLGGANLQPPYVLVGHSFGGLIVRLYQQQHPEQVAAMVLLDPVVRSEWRDASPGKLRMLARGVRLSRRGAMLARAGIVGLALKLLTGGSQRIPKLLARASAGRGAGVAERLTGEVRKLPSELWPTIATHWSNPRSFRAMAEYLEKLPVSVTQLDEARTLGDLPLVVLSSERSTAEALQEHAADTRLSSRGEHIVVPACGHWIQLDAPEAVVAAIKRVVLLTSLPSMI